MRVQPGLERGIGDAVEVFDAVDAAIDELGGPETAGDTLDDIAAEPESNDSGNDFNESQLESPTDPLDETSAPGWWRDCWRLR